jgi:hypothetical protein
MKTLHIKLFLSVIAFHICVTGNAKSIIIVKNHLAIAGIVLPDSASQQLKNAAVTLQNYIKQSTGAVLPISSKFINNTNNIQIGATAFVRDHGINLKGLDEDAFILQTVDSHNFIIVGGSDWGTEFGVYSFLEHFLGIHWLMPTESWTDVPLHPNLILPDIRKISSPYYISRQISPLYIEVRTDLGIWTRFNRLKGRINFSHNLAKLFPTREYLKTNPDFFSKVNGQSIALKDSQDYKWQPNFSAPGIADSAASKIIRYFYHNPNADSYSLGINDYPYFDQSPASLARRNGKKNYLGMEDVSNDYFQWVNEVLQKVLQVFPNKMFGLLAYENVAEPPSPQIGVDRHVVPFLTYERLRWADPVLQKQGHLLTEKWEEECAVLGWYDYIYGSNYLVPRVWFHQMKDYLKWGSRHKVKYYYAELYPNWAEGPKAWVLSKLLWNPNYNVDSLLHIWYVSAGGEKAAPKLKAYFSLWEKFWSKDVFTRNWNTNKNQFLNFTDISYLEDVPVKYINLSSKLLNEAFNLAETSMQKQRISELEKMWQVYKTAYLIYNDSSITENKKRQNLVTSPEFLGVLKNLKNDPLYAQTIQWIEKVLDISKQQ